MNNEMIIPILTSQDVVYRKAIEFLYASVMDDDGLIDYFLHNSEHIEKVNRDKPNIVPHLVKLPEFQSPLAKRNASCRNFNYRRNNELLSDQYIKDMFSAILQISGRKQYPSAGGIYPINIWVTIFHDRIKTSLKEGIYLYNQNLNCLELKIPCDAKMFISSFHYSENSLDKFSFAVLFTMDINEAIKKYKLRGVLMAAMEVGSIYQELTRISQIQGLDTLVYGGFRVHAISQALGLNQLFQFPLMMQLFGHEK